MSLRGAKLKALPVEIIQHPINAPASDSDVGALILITECTNQIKIVLSVTYVVSAG